MAFATKLETWYADFGRDLPWRGIDNPYYIWLSEIILQQTRIEQGRDYYLRFIKTFPTIASLSEATEEQVLRLWQGLGYYSRARNLHVAARYIMEHFNGQFPSTYEDLMSLKGIGRYTAAAIASFAFKLPYPVIDGNVYRFVSRLYGITTPIATDAAYKEFEQVLLLLIDKEHPDIFNAALMDFGSLQCKPTPTCEVCPFVNECAAWLTKRVDMLPVKIKKRTPTDRWFIYLDVRCGDKLIMKQRTNKDIWRGLWEFPLIETPVEFSQADILQAATDYAKREWGVENVSFNIAAQYVHKLTHRTIHACFVRTELETLPPQMTSVTKKELDNLPVSQLMNRYFHPQSKL